MSQPIEPKPTAHAPEFADAGFFLLRTPLLPAEDLQAWSSELTAFSAWQQNRLDREWASSWERDVRMLRGRLAAIVERPEVRQALAVASPSLMAGLDAWRLDPDSKKGIQAERALVRYFVRMAGRSTPFGLFSGCSLGRIQSPREEPTAALTLAPQGTYRTTTRLDFDYVFTLTAALRNEPAIQDKLKFYPNSTLFRVADAWQYIEARQQGGRRSHHMSSLETDPFLEAVLARAESGATKRQLEEAVVVAAGSFEVTAEEVRQYVEDILATGCLVSTLSPQVTGDSPLEDILDQLKQLDPGGRAHQVLGQVKQALAQLDSGGIGPRPAIYESIEMLLSDLPAAVDPARLLQSDMSKPAGEAVLPAAVTEQVRETVELLRCLNHSVEPDELRAFREAFVQRYEHARVPLLEALDSEAGIGFGRTVCDSSPLLRGLQYSGQKSGGGKEFRAAQQMLLAKLIESQRTGAKEILLTAADVPYRDEDTLADSFSVNCSVAARSAEALANGEFELRVMGAVGPDGARLLGRFCHTDDQLNSLVKEYLREEEQHSPDAIYAEVVHLPEGRIGNVLCRPVLREYEIVYAGRSGAPRERQIAASDLLVTVEDGSVVLYSRRLGRRVIPRLTSAHGFMDNSMAPVYRFLCYLQHQHAVATPGFGWGPLDELPHLPRVRVGRAIVSLERWRMSRDQIEALAAVKGSVRFAAVQEWRLQQGLPRWVVLEESDHSLPVDLDNVLSVDAFVHVISRGSTATVRELHPETGALCVTGPEGHFFHELTIPLRRVSIRAVKPRASASHANSPDVAKGERTLAPGSEWLYWKFYSGLGFSDELVGRHLRSLLDEGQNRGLVDQWFFLRYQDPHNHVRLRLRSQRHLVPELFHLVTQWMEPHLASGRLWKVQTDTYEREVERYGGLQGVQAAEQIFHADSEAVVRMLAALGSGDEAMELRWQAALAGMDRLLDDLGCDLAAKCAVATNMRDAMRREFGAGLLMKKLVGDRFRLLRGRCQAMVEAPPELLRRVLDKRTPAVRGAAQWMDELRAQSRLSLSREELAASYVHMHVNRLLRAAHRQHELVLYDFLTRVYESQLVRRQQARSGAGRVLVS